MAARINPFEFLFRKKTQAPKEPRTRRALFGSGGNLTIFAVDEGWIKIARGTARSDKGQIEFLEALSIQGLEDEEIASEIRKLMSAGHLNSGKYLIVHPAHLTRTKLLRLPSTDLAELKVMVDLQVEKNTPDAKEETLTYFRKISTDTDGYTSVFLVMVHQDRVYRAVQLVSKAIKRLVPVASGVDGLINWYHQYASSKKEAIAGSVLLLDFDYAYAAVMVVQGKEAYFHRSVPLRAESLLHDPLGEESDKFVAELHRTLLAYEDEGVKSPCTQAVLIGDIAILGKLAEKIEKEMKLVVTVVPAAAGLRLGKGPGEVMLHKPEFSFASVFGFYSGAPAGDLTPLAVKMRQTFERKVKMTSLIGGQVLVALLLASGFLLTKIHREMEYAEYLEVHSKQMEQPTRELETSLEHLKIVKDRLAKHGVLLESVVTTAKATPPEVKWDTLTYTQAEGMVLKGVSSDMSKVFEMVSELEKSPLYTKPEARKVAKRKVDGKDVTDFEVTMPLAEPV